MPITFRRDPIGGVDWAFLPKERGSDERSIFSLARFTESGRVSLVGNADKPDGKFIPMNNPKYNYAPTFAAFKRLAEEFVADAHEETT